MTTVTELDAATAQAIAEALGALAGRTDRRSSPAPASRPTPASPTIAGSGAPVRTPMTVEQFLANEDARRRYWVGSHLGWRAFAAAEPNAGHLALAQLESARRRERA